MLKLRRPLVSLSMVVLVLAATTFSIHAYITVFGSFEKFTAVWLAHDILVAHMNQTNGKWPTKWNDLEPQFASINSQAYGVPDLAWLRDRVTINFDFEPSSLNPAHATQANAMRVMQMVDGTDNDEIQEANRRIVSFVLDRRFPVVEP